MIYMPTIPTPLVEAFTAAGGFIDGHFIVRGRHTDKIGLPGASLLNRGLHEQICRELAEHLCQYRPTAVVVPAFGGMPYAELVSAFLGLPLWVAERSADGKFKLPRDDLPKTRVVVVDSSCHSLGTLISVDNATRQAGAEVVAAAVVVRTMVEKLEPRAEHKEWRAPLYSFCSALVKSWNPQECPMCSHGIPVQSKPLLYAQTLLKSSNLATSAFISSRS